MFHVDWGIQNFERNCLQYRLQPLGIVDCSRLAHCLNSASS
jgi:hypothetical protein